jgi:hypothetical protein
VETTPSAKAVVDEKKTSAATFQGSRRVVRYGEQIYGNGMCQVTTRQRRVFCHIRNKFRGRSKRDNMVTVNGWIWSELALEQWVLSPQPQRRVQDTAHPKNVLKLISRSYILAQSATTLEVAVFYLLNSVSVITCWRPNGHCGFEFGRTCRIRRNARTRRRRRNRKRQPGFQVHRLSQQTIFV